MKTYIYFNKEIRQELSQQYKQSATLTQSPVLNRPRLSWGLTFLLDSWWIYQESLHSGYPIHSLCADAQSSRWLVLVSYWDAYWTRLYLSLKSGNDFTQCDHWRLHSSRRRDSADWALLRVQEVKRRSTIFKLLGWNH